MPDSKDNVQIWAVFKFLPTNPKKTIFFLLRRFLLNKEKNYSQLNSSYAYDIQSNSTGRYDTSVLWIYWWLTCTLACNPQSCPGIDIHKENWQRNINKLNRLWPVLHTHHVVLYIISDRQHGHLTSRNFKVKCVKASINLICSVDFSLKIQLKHKKITTIKQRNIRSLIRVMLHWWKSMRMNLNVYQE